MSYLMKVVKPGRYNGRLLKAGDTFEANRQYARIWEGLKYATRVIEPVVEPEPEEPDTGDELEIDNLAILRNTYHELSGKRAYHGWDEKQLSEKIAKLREED